MKIHLNRSQYALFALATLVAASGCDEKKSAGAGNFCSDIDQLIWSSDRGAPPPSSGPASETFNIFMMDGHGGNRTQLTTDSWPVINQHPVFSTDCQKIVWAHGAAGHSSIWIMNRAGSAKAQVAAPPAEAEDGHPWVGLDGNIYFVRHRHPSHVHTIWRMALNGSGPVELVGGDDKDRFHPNLQRDGKLVLYTSSPAGAPTGSEIRIFDQQSRQDRSVYAPGWPVSGATWSPDGAKVVVAEDHDRNGRYRIVEISYPGGTLTRTLTDDQQDNTIPYYAYPSGAAIGWIRWPGGRRTRNVARMNADGSGQTLLTNDAYENTKIVGELEITPPTVAGGREHCKPRPVGCYPTPPPCEKVLLPDAVRKNAEDLGRTTAQGQKGPGPLGAPEDYLGFMNKDLLVYIERSQPYATPELQKAAIGLRGYLSGQSDKDVQERVADIYVNSYLAELEQAGRQK